MDCLIIFDCDGVLVDTATIIAQSLARTLTESGFPCTPAYCSREFSGLTPDELWTKAEKVIGLPLGPDLREQAHLEVVEAMERDLAPVAGIEHALDSIDLPTCVASSSSHEWVRAVLARTGLLPRFDGRIFSAEDVGQAKPAPDLFLFAAKDMGVAPNRCAVVEDSVSGVLGGRRAGMSVFGFARPNEAPTLSAHGATVFMRMRELPALLQAWAGRLPAP